MLFSVQEQGMKFLSGKILENIDAGRHYDCIFLMKYMQLRFFKCNLFGFGYIAVEFSIISLVVIIRIIRNVIVSWICSW